MYIYLYNDYKLAPQDIPLIRGIVQFQFYQRRLELGSRLRIRAGDISSLSSSKHSNGHYSSTGGILLPHRSGKYLSLSIDIK